MCKEAGARNVVVRVSDVTDEKKMEEIINAYDDQYPINSVYPCAALNDTPIRPLPNTVSVRIINLSNE